MADTLVLNQNYVAVGLHTQQLTITAAGIYYAKVDLTELPPSGISVVVNQNGSPVFTAAAVSPTQGALQFKTTLSCATNDVIQVVVSSSNSNDKMLNTVKTNMSIGQGI
jgi:hypothetical protein